MLKKILLCCLPACFLLMVCSIAFAGKVVYFEISPSAIKEISVNHEQGSISFYINGIYYFYDIQAKETWQKILAVSHLLADIRNASVLQVKSQPYGLHQKIVNLLLFYGEHTIPDSLKDAPVKGKD